LFGSCIIHILYTGCAKIKKNNSGAKRLNIFLLENVAFYFRDSNNVINHHHLPNLKNIFFSGIKNLQSKNSLPIENSINSSINATKRGFYKEIWKNDSFMLRNK
jgi:hypothetical protein